MADEHAVRIAEARCQAQMKRYRDKGNWAQWVVMIE